MLFSSGNNIAISLANRPQSINPNILHQLPSLPRSVNGYLVCWNSNQENKTNFTQYSR